MLINWEKLIYYFTFTRNHFISLFFILKRVILSSILFLDFAHFDDKSFFLKKIVLLASNTYDDYLLHSGEFHVQILVGGPNSNFPKQFRNIVFINEQRYVITPALARCSFDTSLYFE